MRRSEGRSQRSEIRDQRPEKKAAPGDVSGDAAVGGGICHDDGMDSGTGIAACGWRGGIEQCVPIITAENVVVRFEIVRI